MKAELPKLSDFPVGSPCGFHGQMEVASEATSFFFYLIFCSAMAPDPHRFSQQDQQ